MTGSGTRALLVGCGPRGTGHARALAGLAGVDLAGCCDVDPGRLERFAAAYGVRRGFRRLDEAVEAVRPDLVTVVTPPSARLELVRAAVRARPGAVVVEKPMALLPGDGHAMVEACRAAGTRLFVNHQLRFFRPLRRFRALLAREPLGRLRYVRASTRCSLLEQGTHLFDLVQFLLGDRAGWSAVLAQTDGREGDDRVPDSPRHAAGVALLEDGPRVYFECGPEAAWWPGSDSPWHQLGIELVGTRGSAGCSLNRGWWCDAGGTHTGEDYVHDVEEEVAEPLFFDSVLAAVRDGRPHPTDAAASLRSFDLVMAVQRSALRREWTRPGTATDDDVRRLRAGCAERTGPGRG